MRSHLSFLMRLQCIDQLIQEEEFVSFEKLQKALKCSAPTLKRDIRYMREELGAPIAYSYKQNGYYYSQDGKFASRRLTALKDLPSTWFTPDELRVLMDVVQQFERVGEDEYGLLAGDMQAMRARLLSLVRTDKITTRELIKRVKVVSPEYRREKLQFFNEVGVGLSQRRRLLITYFAQGRGVETLREVSPVRLVNYRSRWYLEAWCHQSEDLRTFAVDNIRSCELSDKRCRVVAMREVEERFDSTYGIFSSAQEDIQKAVIAIDAVMTPYVRLEVWHCAQKVTENEDGTMLLEVPYASEIEIGNRILGIGPHAEVREPESLRNYVADLARQTAELYAGVG